MAHDVISTCPVCSDELVVTRLRCRSAGRRSKASSASGASAPRPRPAHAARELPAARGNLREMERELGISYPTVRARVEASSARSASGRGGRALRGGDDPVQTREADPRAGGPPRDQRRGGRPGHPRHGRTPMTTAAHPTSIEHVIGAGTVGPAACAAATRVSSASPATPSGWPAMDGRPPDTFDVDAADGRSTVRAPPGSRSGRSGAHHAHLDVEVPARATLVLEGASGDIQANGPHRRAALPDGLRRHQPSRVSGTVSVEAASGDIAMVTASRPWRCGADGVGRPGPGRPPSRACGATTSGRRSGRGRAHGPGPSTSRPSAATPSSRSPAVSRIEVSTVTGDVSADVPHRSERADGRRVVVVGDGREKACRQHHVRRRPHREGATARRPRSSPLRPWRLRQGASPAPEPTPGPANVSDAAIAAAYDEARLRILRSVERGEIDVAEAGRRLEALDAAGIGEDATRERRTRACPAARRRRPPDGRRGCSAPRRPEAAQAPPPSAPAAPGEPGPPTTRPASAVRIEVSDAGRKVVNLRIPLALGRTALGGVPGLSEDATKQIREAISAVLQGTRIRRRGREGRRRPRGARVARWMR